METVIQAFRDHGEMSATELAERTGVDPTIARSHLNRYRDQRYSADNGVWRLIGEED
jgi:predicted ArsR family transcriptional regulator